MPTLLSQGGPMIWLILAASALAVVVFVERLLYFHRAQINSSEFLNGVRTVLKRENVVEALSICDATPGPVARLVKVAILNRDLGREGVKEVLHEAGQQEIPRLEERLTMLATIGQVAPLMGLLGTVLGFMEIFSSMQKEGPLAHMSGMAGGVWQALIATGAGLALAIPCYVAYNYLVTRVKAITLDMEKASSDILTLVSEISPQAPRK